MIDDIQIKEINAADTWPLRQRVMWPEKPIQAVKLADDDIGNHYGLFKNGQLVAVVSLFIKAKEAQFRKFATETAEQGNGYGTKLLLHLLQIARQNRVGLLWCNARIDKLPFYSRFGMLETGIKSAKDGIEYMRMQKQLQE